jgi:hypothetical protein
LASTAGVANARPNALLARLTRFLDSTDTRLSTTRAIVGTVTVLGLGLRILVVRGFSWKEATSGYTAGLPFGQLTHAITRSKVAPLNVALLWGVAHTLGSTEFDLRLPSLLFGALTIPMLYLAGRALYSEEVGLLAAVAGAIGALGVWYAQDAGAASLAILLTTTTIWALQRALATNRQALWLAWGAAGAVLIWTQWSAALVVAAEVAMVVVATRGPVRGAGPPVRRRDNRRPFVAIGLVVVATVIALPLMRAQGHGPGLSHLGTTIHSLGHHNDLSAARILGLLVQLTWGFHAVGIIADAVALWPVLILAMVLLLGRSRHPSHWMLIAVIALPIAVAAAAAALDDPNALQVGGLAEIVPAIYLVVAGVIGAAVPTRFGRRAFAAAVGVVLACGLVMQQTDTGAPGLYGYRAAFTQISSVATPASWIAYAEPDLGPVVKYFAPSLHQLPLDATVREVPAGAPVYVIGSSGRTPADGPSEVAALKRLEAGRRLVTVFRAPHVVVWELS